MQRVKVVCQGRMCRERFELYRYVRSHARADGYVYCDDCCKDGLCRLQDIEPSSVNEFEFCALFCPKSNPADKR